MDKKSMVFIVAALAVAFLIGANTNAVPDEIKARQFIVVDDEGKPPTRTHLRTYVRRFMAMSRAEFDAPRSASGKWTIAHQISHRHMREMLQSPMDKNRGMQRWLRFKEEFDRDDGQPVQLTRED